MSNQPFHNKFFTEENSPIPLIPADDAWEAMQAKLNTQFPEKKRRRMIAWLPPVGCALLLLLLGGGYALWQYTTPGRMSKTHDLAKQTTDKEKSQAFTQETAAAQPPATDTPANEAQTGTPTLTQSLEPATALLTTKTTSTSKQPPQPNKKPASATTSRNGTPQLSKQEQNREYATHYNNSLRPSPVAGIQYAASIHVQPARPPKPLWLPEESLITDSSGNKPAPKYVFAMGLQAEVPVPIYKPDVYFKTPLGHDRFYQPISPGIWASVTKKRHRLTGEFKPFASAPLSYGKPFDKGPFDLPDRGTFWGDRTVVKVFGTQLALQYTYEVRKHWWVGIGVDRSWWRKALIQVDSLGRKSFWYGVHKNEASFLRATQWGAVAHLAYESKAWTGTLQAGTPFRATVKGGSFPLWLRLGVRFRLLQSRQEATTTKVPVVQATLP